MAAYFLDSSAVLKLYLAETGSNWMRSLVDPIAANSITVAAICGVEVVAAITRRAKGQSISTANAALAINEFQLDFRGEFELTEITIALIGSDAACRATRSARLRCGAARRRPGGRCGGPMNRELAHAGLSRCGAQLRGLCRRPRNRRPE